MMKKKKRVDAPINGQPEKKRKLNDIKTLEEDEEMISVSKITANQESNTSKSVVEEEES